MKAGFIWTCVDNPFKDVETLSYVIDNAKQISKQYFFRKCDVDIETKKNMKEYPNDYSYYSQDWIYFFIWSMIEHFYTSIQYYKDIAFKS